MSDPYVLFLVMMAMFFNESSLVLISQLVSEEKFCIIVNDDDGQRRTPSDGNSSLGLWPGELKLQGFFVRGIIIEIVLE